MIENLSFPEYLYLIKFPQRLGSYDPSTSMIFCTARLYPSIASSLSTYAHSFGCFSSENVERPLAAPSGKPIKISAPVKSRPHRYSPPSGELAIWLSINANCVSRLGERNFDSTAPVIMVASGLMKKGELVLMSVSC